MAERDQPTWAHSAARVSPYTAGLRCRCPRCGEGRLYHGLLAVAETCGVCGLDLGQADSGDGPAVFIILILGALVVPLALLLEVTALPPLWVHALIWPGVILGGSVALLRPAKALLIALQFKHKAADTGLRAADAPPAEAEPAADPDADPDRRA
jgi:uncharacterized protein (DUF983 family)